MSDCYLICAVKGFSRGSLRNREVSQQSSVGCCFYFPTVVTSSTFGRAQRRIGNPEIIDLNVIAVPSSHSRVLVFALRKLRAHETALAASCELAAREQAGDLAIFQRFLLSNDHTIRNRRNTPFPCHCD